MRRIPHDSVYTDRLSERALCYDFPADKAFIDGLHAMQSYFVARGSNIDIPVVRVMNTVHWLVAYLYATSCSGEQLEYDAMTYNSVGRDKQLMYVSLIVLIAMLNRTEGARAKACRSMMLENRTEDFYEGVSLYEQWLDGGLEHYTDEDFQIDLMDELNEYKTKYNLAQKEIYQLQKQLNMKDEEKQPVTNIFNGPYIANNYVQDGGKQILSAENVYWSDSEKPEIGLPETAAQIDPATVLAIPNEGKYSEVRRYIEERVRFDEEFKRLYNDKPLTEFCSTLTKIFGWFVDENSLRRNLNRHVK